MNSTPALRAVGRPRKQKTPISENEKSLIQTIAPQPIIEPTPETTTFTNDDVITFEKDAPSTHISLTTPVPTTKIPTDIIVQETTESISTKNGSDKVFWKDIVQNVASLDWTGWSPEQQALFLSESVLQAYPWLPEMENAKRCIREPAWTDDFILTFLEGWNHERVQKGFPNIWVEQLNWYRTQADWKMKMIEYFQHISAPGWNLDWFWKNCQRVYNGEFHQRNNIEKIRNQVIQLLNIPQPEQRSPEWYTMRERMVTASNWGTVLGESKYETLKSFLAKKAGKEKPFTGNAATRWGQKYEPVANMIYERRMCPEGVRVLEFGLIGHPLWTFLGASPDGITQDGIMLEIKCPSSRVPTGIPPRHYWCQVQGQLEICELNRCDFLECVLQEVTESEWLEWNVASTPRNTGEIGCMPKSPDGIREYGIVLRFTCPEKGPGEEKFSYSPINMPRDERYSWIEKECIAEKSHELIDITYWVLKAVSCVPIYRDREWFNQTALPTLARVWNRLVELKANQQPEVDEYGFDNFYTQTSVVSEEDNNHPSNTQKKKERNETSHGTTIDGDDMSFLCAS